MIWWTVHLKVLLKQFVKMHKDNQLVLYKAHWIRLSLKYLNWQSRNHPRVILNVLLLILKTDTTVTAFSTEPRTEKLMVTLKAKGSGTFFRFFYKSQTVISWEQWGLLRKEFVPFYWTCKIQILQWETIGVRWSCKKVVSRIPNLLLFRRQQHLHMILLFQNIA